MDRKLVVRERKAPNNDLARPQVWSGSDWEVATETQKLSFFEWGLEVICRFAKWTGVRDHLRSRRPGHPSIAGNAVTPRQTQFSFPAASGRLFHRA